MSRMWEPSPSPQESWSDAEGGNEDGEWPVKAIVGEEIRLDGTSRYEVRPPHTSVNPAPIILTFIVHDT
ncbi:hypothetical protein HD554DRAFT_2082081 [Boletus coccyginus]|nr:hypothetical protein HD554DRAFT_2082081 [Boletus coccyginus]